MRKVIFVLLISSFALCLANPIESDEKNAEKLIEEFRSLTDKLVDVFEKGR